MHTGRSSSAEVCCDYLRYRECEQSPLPLAVAKKAFCNLQQRVWTVFIAQLPCGEPLWHPVLPGRPHDCGQLLQLVRATLSSTPQTRRPPPPLTPLPPPEVLFQCHLRS